MPAYPVVNGAEVAGPTAKRPSNASTGATYYDTDVGAALVYNGTAWVSPSGNLIGASTAAAGSSTSDAGALPAGTASVYPTTAADGTKGVKIDVADKVTGRMLFIGNGVSNAILKVYPPAGGTINGASANAAFSSASGKGVIILCLSSADNTWLAW